jgi:hypothetical protein
MAAVALAMFIIPGGVYIHVLANAWEMQWFFTMLPIFALIKGGCCCWQEKHWLHGGKYAAPD